MFISRSTLAAALVVVAAITVSWQAAAATDGARPLPPLKAFLRTPAFGSPQPSPDGRWVAALSEGAGGRRVLVVIDPTDIGKSKVVAAFSDADVERFDWVSSRRLLYSAVDSQRGSADQLGPGLYAVDVDGSYQRQLVDRQFRGVLTGQRSLQDRSLPFYTFLLGPTRSRTSDDVFVSQYPINIQTWRPGMELPDPVLYRLDTRTARLTPVAQGSPPGQGTWAIDARDEPRIAIKQREGMIRVYQRKGDSEEWSLLLEYPAIGGEGFVPQVVRADGKVLVLARRGRDTEALYVYDPQTRSFEDKPLVSMEGFDFGGRVFLGGETGDQLLGVRLNGDAPATVWVAPALRKLQQGVDEKLRGRINLLTVAQAADAPFAVVESFSDRIPPTFYLLDTRSGALTQIARAFPDIDPATMGRVRFERIAARDGLSIPTYVTLPAGVADKPATALPAVVLVHGGPWMRGRSFGWNGQAQALASRGYVVLEPDFRGSTGYGFKHFQAGWKQWGLAMQDDLVDVTRWAVAQGLADPKRVCVMGASYGGYAALMALARDGDTFRCGVSYVGVTDVALMFTASWSDVTDSARRYTYAPLIGDPVREAEALKAVSPVTVAGRIRQPVLLGHGTHDLRVPLEHGQRFRDALSRGNADVEWFEYGNEGHGLVHLENRLDFYERVLKFLDRNIGASAR